MRKFLSSAWRIWANALGAKTGRTDREANIVAVLRTMFYLVTLLTEFAILLHNVPIIMERYQCQ